MPKGYGRLGRWEEMWRKVGIVEGPGPRPQAKHLEGGILKLSHRVVIRMPGSR